MDRFSKIIKERSVPGILIFDLHGRLLYSNREALEMHLVPQTEETATGSFPAQIYDLCRQLNNGPEAQGIDLDCPVVTDVKGLTYSLRSFFIGGHGGEDLGTHILVLIEKVVEHRKVDMEKAQRDFQLSMREVEVVRLICQGLTNRNISETMFISEHTVKVHIRNIMKKMKASTRNEIIAFLK